MMRTGMLLTGSPAGVAAKGTSPLVEKFVVLPRSPTVMGGHDDSTFVKHVSPSHINGDRAKYCCILNSSTV